MSAFTRDDVIRYLSDEIQDSKTRDEIEHALQTDPRVATWFREIEHVCDFVLAADPSGEPLCDEISAEALAELRDIHVACQANTARNRASTLGGESLDSVLSAILADVRAGKAVILPAAEAMEVADSYSCELAGPALAADSTHTGPPPLLDVGTPPQWHAGFLYLKYAADDLPLGVARLLACEKTTRRVLASAVIALPRYRSSRGEYRSAAVDARRLFGSSLPDVDATVFVIPATERNAESFEVAEVEALLADPTIAENAVRDEIASLLAQIRSEGNRP